MKLNGPLPSGEILGAANPSQSLVALVLLQ